MAIVMGTTTVIVTGNILRDLKFTAFNVQVNLQRRQYSDVNRVVANELIQSQYDVSHTKKSLRNHRRLFFYQ